jgi:L-serine/L-threonine ammonia-lyase
LAKGLQDSSESKVHFISSSASNAGLAATTAAKMLEQDVTVIVPETTKPLMQDKITAAGGNVKVHGRDFPEADEYAKKLVKQELNGVFVPPFDHEYIWEGLHKH